MKAGPSLTSGERSLRIRADLKLDTISGEGRRGLLLAGVSIDAIAQVCLHIHTTTCYHAGLLRLPLVRLHLRLKQGRLWVFVTVGQGVPAPALTTEQGGVFVLSSHLTFLVHWHTVCSRAGLSHRAMDVGERVEKQTAKSCFYVSGKVSCLETFFCRIMLYIEFLAKQLQLARSFTAAIYVIDLYM